MKTKSAYFFTSNEETEKREFYVRDVARSTSAAPTFFPPAKIKNLAPNPDAAKDPDKMINLDGGVFANNPLMCAFAEVRNTDFKHRGFNKDEKPTVNDMVFQVGTEEVGVITRFGKYVRTVNPGLNLKMPFAEDVFKVPVERQQKLEFGFRTLAAGVNSEYTRQGTKDESLMLTGDLNLADVEWVVQYRIDNAYNYLFKVRNPETTMN